MEIKRLKENRQDEKEKLERWKTRPNLPKQDHSRGNRPRLAQGLAIQVHSSEVGLFLVKLA